MSVVNMGELDGNGSTGNNHLPKNIIYDNRVERSENEVVNHNPYQYFRFGFIQQLIILITILGIESVLFVLTDKFIVDISTRNVIGILLIVAFTLSFIFYILDYD
jgi:hypothetical protein